MADNIKILTGVRPRMASVRVKTRTSNDETYEIEFKANNTFNRIGLEEIQSISFALNPTYLVLVPATSNIQNPEHEIKLITYNAGDKLFKYEHKTSNQSAIELYNDMKSPQGRTTITVKVTYGDKTDTYNITVLKK